MVTWLILSLIFIIALISLLFLLFYKKTLIDSYSEEGVFRNNKVEVRNSSIHGRGVFALQDFKEGDVIEYAPMIITTECDKIADIMTDYYIALSQENVCGYGMGYFNYYNDSKEPNAQFTVDENDKSVTIRAIKDIKRGEEIFHSYGENYWKHRGIDRNDL